MQAHPLVRSIASAAFTLYKSVRLTSEIGLIVQSHPIRDVLLQWYVHARSVGRPDEITYSFIHLSDTHGLELTRTALEWVEGSQPVWPDLAKFSLIDKIFVSLRSKNVGVFIFWFLLFVFAIFLRLDWHILLAETNKNIIRMVWLENSKSKLHFREKLPNCGQRKFQSQHRILDGHFHINW